MSRKMRIWILVSLLSAAAVLGACKREVIICRMEADFWQDCVWLRCEDKGTALVLLKYDNETPDTPCTLGGLTEEQKKTVSGLRTGDRIRIRIDGVNESYPAQAYVKELEFVAEGSPEDVDPELIARLREMGWKIITAEESKAGDGSASAEKRKAEDGSTAAEKRKADDGSAGADQETAAAVCINDVTYYNTGEKAAEPDAHVIEYVELPFGADTAGIVTAFATLEEDKMVVCMIDGEWYEFVVK